MILPPESCMKKWIKFFWLSKTCPVWPSLRNWKPPYLFSRKAIWPRVKVCSDKCHNFIQDGSYIKILNFTAYCTFLDVEGSWASWQRVLADGASHIASLCKPQPPIPIMSLVRNISFQVAWHFSSVCARNWTQRKHPSVPVLRWMDYYTDGVWGNSTYFKRFKCGFFTSVKEWQGKPWYSTTFYHFYPFMLILFSKSYESLQALIVQWMCGCYVHWMFWH